MQYEEKKKLIDDPLGPLVSIITPLYNSEEFIAETIKSVQAQTYGNWEHIIVNDASTDNAAAIVRSMATKSSKKISSVC